MKNTKNAFTLVELIVVITILAVLATVAFISLTGYSQEAKNSKVASDLRSLTSALEAGTAKGDYGLTSIVDATETDFAVTGAANDGDITLAGAAITNKYDVGFIDFATIKQNGDDFVDSDENPYVFAYTASGSFAGYNLAGQTKNSAGVALPYITGNYVQVETTDVTSLVSQSGSNEVLDEEVALANGSDIYGN